VTGEHEALGTPWYNHFWPWFIVLLMGVSIVGALATVWIAFSNADPVVSENWYAEGVDINRRLERQHRATILGLRASLELANAEGRMVVHLEGPGTDRLRAVRLHLSHPTVASRDRSLVLERVGPARFEVVMSDGPDALDGRWYAVLEPGAVADPAIAHTDRDWRLTGTFRMPASEPIPFGEDG
jgi:hypothetical protein